VERRKTTKNRGVVLKYLVIKVKDREHFLELQDDLYSRGCRWMDYSGIEHGEKGVCCFMGKYNCFSAPNDVKYVFVWENKRMTYDWRPLDDILFMSSCNSYESVEEGDFDRKIGPQLTSCVTIDGKSFWVSSTTAKFVCEYCASNGGASPRKKGG
jgi:hypothetical protein